MHVEAAFPKYFSQFFRREKRRDFFTGHTSVIVQFLSWLLNSGTGLETPAIAEAVRLCLLVAHLPSCSDS